MLGAVKVWPGKRRALGKVGATANLDSSCAPGRDEETGFQVEQRNRSRNQERKIAALKPLDNKSPIQGFGEGKDRACIFGPDGLFHRTETGISPSPSPKARELKDISTCARKPDLRGTAWWWTHSTATGLHLNSLITGKITGNF